MRLSPPKFSGAIGVDGYYFLNNYQERLCKLDLLESYGVDYTSF